MGIIESILTSKVKLYGVTALIALLVIFGIWVLHIYRENERLQLLEKQNKQNIAALTDSVNQKRAQLVQSAAFVRDLNAEVKKAKHEYIALQAHFKSYIDSIHFAGSSVPIITDSTIMVPFSGEKSIAAFRGYTIYEPKTKRGDWDLTLTFPNPVETDVRLLQKDELWEFEVKSLTPGILVMGGGALDADTYRRLQKYSPPEPMNRFMIGVAVGQHGGPEIGYRLDNWNIGAHYSIFNQYSDFYKNLYIHAVWCPF
jgi:hypothetical protein